MTTELDLLAAARPNLQSLSAETLSLAERRQLLETITASPAGSAAPARPRPRMRLRLGLVAVTVIAVAAALAVIAHPWSGSTPRYTDAAFTVTPNADGSVRIVIHWSELADPAALQARLKEVHAPVLILTGTATVRRSTDGPLSLTPPCALPFSGVGYSSKAVQWDFPDRASEVNGIVVRPKYFPKDGTFVIEAFTSPGEHRYAPVLSFMAVGKVPTCVAPVGESSFSPTN